MTTNVTVNGKPLAEHLEQEAAAEIAEVRQAEVRERTWRAPGARSKFGNTSRSRTSSGTVIFTRQGRETHIIIAGTLFSWAEKAPYVRSGESILGALEFDEKTDRIKCHECGRWYESISFHLPKSHHRDVGAYRAAHGLTRNTSLMIPRLSEDCQTRARTMMSRHWSDDTIRACASRIGLATAKRIANSSPKRKPLAESDNLHARCRAQLSVRISALYRELRRPLTCADIERAGIAGKTTILRVFGKKDDSSGSCRSWHSDGDTKTNRVGSPVFG